MSDNGREEKEGVDFKKNSESADVAEGTNLSKEDLYARMKSLEREVEERNKEYNDLHERHVRMAADFDNYRKRVAKEKADIIAYGNEELIKALLNVIDNLERALGHSESGEESGPIVEGIKLVYKHFLSSLEKFGVQTVDASKGQEFDPRYHQAIERVESRDVTPGIILSEVLKGYILRDRLLRPALVVVSKEPKGASTEGAYSAKSEEEKKTEDGSGELLDLVNEDLDKD